MRFKVPLVLLLASATYVLHLGFSEQLYLYIHPRYVLFTLVLTALGLILVVADSYLNGKDHKDHAHEPGILSLLPLIGLVIVAVLLPAQALTSATVSQRTTDSGSIVATSEAKPINTLFAGSSKGLPMTDWQRLLAANKDPAYYKNKPAVISGFVYDAKLGADTIWLSRFVVTCCAVDAQPIGIPVHFKNWQSDYEEDEWLEVEGEFELAPTAQGEQLVLIPSSVNKIERPDNPYANQ